MVIPPAVGLIIALATRGQVPAEMPKALDTEIRGRGERPEDAGNHTAAEAAC